MHLLLFVIFWDTTVNCRVFFFFFEKFYYKEKKNTREIQENENEKEKEKEKKKNGLLYFWVSGVSCECVLGTITQV